MSIPYISFIGCIVQPAVYIYSIASMSGFCVQNEKKLCTHLYNFWVRWVKINVSVGHERSKQLPYSLSLRLMVHAVSCSPSAAPLMGLVRPKLETLCMLTIDGNVAV